MMKMIKNSIVDEITENIKNKFTIVEASIDNFPKQTKIIEKKEESDEIKVTKEVTKEAFAEKDLDCSLSLSLSIENGTFQASEGRQN